MRRAALVLLLLLVPSWGAIQTAVVVFDSPAQADGPIDATGLTAVVFLLDDSRFSLNAHLLGTIEERTFNESYAETDVDRVGYGNPPLPRQEPTLRAFPKGTTFTASGGHGPASIYIQAESIALNASALRTIISALPSSSCVDQLLSDGETYSRSVRAGLGCNDRPRVALRMEAPPGPITLDVRVTGIKVLELHNVAIACQTEFCPNGGGRTSTGWADANKRAAVAEYRYVRLTVEAGNATATGLVRTAIGAADQASLHVEGQFRMPRAEGQLNCRNCTMDGNRTLFAEGGPILENLRPEQGRLSATIAGTATLRVDEEPPLGWQAPAAAVAAGAVVAVALLWRILLALAARVRPSAAMAHPRRQAVFDAVRNNPGIGHSRLAQITGIPLTSLRFHVYILARTNVVVTRKKGRSQVFFENHGRYDHSWQAATALAEPALSQLHGWLLHEGPAQRITIVEAMAARQQWPRRTTEYRLARLVKAGVVIGPDGDRRFVASAPPFRTSLPVMLESCPESAEPESAKSEL